MGIRSIEFRGKRQKNGEWVYGDLLQIPKHELYSIMHEKEDTGNFIVDKNTVGQYTGLKDKNGTKIFEGDIVRVLLHGNPQPVGIVEYGNRGICSYTVVTEAPYSNYLLDNPEDFEVIGNIHDNPELLKGAEK